MPYGKTSAEAIQKAADKLTGGKFYKVPQNGDYVFFCPPWAADQVSPFHEVKLHYGFGFEPIVCAGQGCGVCAANTELFNMKEDKEAQALSAEIYAKAYYIYNLISKVTFLEHAGQCWIMPQANVQMKVEQFSASKALHGWILNCRAFNGDIFDPEAGNLVQLAKDKNSTDPKYARIVGTCHPKKARLHPTLMTLLDNLPDLTTIYEQKSLEEIQSIVNAKLATFRAAKAQPRTVSTVPQFQPVPSVPNAATPIAQVQATTVTSTVMPPVTQMAQGTNPMPNISMGTPPVQAQQIPQIPSVPQVPSVPDVSSAPPIGGMAGMGTMGMAPATNPVKDLEDFEASLKAGK